MAVFHAFLLYLISPSVPSPGLAQLQSLESDRLKFIQGSGNCSPIKHN